MNISSGSSYPASSLSNFAGHRFTIDDVECYSMEGFLQSFFYIYIKNKLYYVLCIFVSKSIKKI